MVNRKEDKKVNRVLAANKAFQAPVEPEKGQKGLIATRNLPGEARYQGRVRNLLDDKVQFGRAIDSATGESFPAKLVAAVPQNSEQIADNAIRQGRPQWRVDQNRAIFLPFLDAAVEFVKKEPSSGGSSRAS